MSILLLNPPLLMEERANLRVFSHIQEPLGLAYLAAAVKKELKEEKIVILDCQVLGYSLADFENYLLKNKFSTVGITMPTLAFFNSKKSAELVKKILNAKVIVGGPHPTSLPEDTLREIPEVDYVVIGEGEQTFVELILAIRNNINLNKIRGIAFRSGTKIKINEPRHFIKDIDFLPMPARDLLMMERYSPSPTFFRKQPAYAIMDARGCPYNCTFCATLSGKSIRQHSKQRICNEIALLIKDFGAKGIIFRSDTFTTNIQHTIELCNEIIKQGLNKKISWHCESRINTISKDLLKLMKKAGCEGIHYGVESGNQRILELINKNIKLEDVPRVFKWTRKAGIRTSAYFMIGLPTERKEETLNTIKFAKKCGADFASFSIFTPYPGSRLFTEIKTEGKLRTLDWRNYSSVLSFSQKITPYVPENRDEFEIKKLHRRAILEFYLRPSLILKHLFYIDSYKRLKILTRGFIALLKEAFKQNFISI